VTDSVVQESSGGGAEWDDSAAPPPLERAVAVVLGIGVTLSSALLVTGVIVTLAARSSRHAATRAMPALRHGALHQPGWTSYSSIAAVIRGVSHGTGPALVMLGVLVLVATPIARVAVSVVVFSVSRDRRYILVTALVLAVLLGSFALG